MLLLLEHLLVYLHPKLHIVFRDLEDGESHRVDVMPHVSLVHPKVGAHALNQIREVSHTSVNVRCVWISRCTQNVRHLKLFVFLDEVPNSLVRSQRCNELAFLIFDHAKLKWSF